MSDTSVPAVWQPGFKHRIYHVGDEWHCLWCSAVSKDYIAHEDCPGPDA